MFVECLFYAFCEVLAALANVQRIIVQWNNDDHPDIVQDNLRSTQDQSSFLLQLSSACFKDRYSLSADLYAFPELLYLIRFRRLFTKDYTFA